MKTMFITRGLPGSGKSTLLKEKVKEKRFRVEADDYFMVSDVYYAFDGSQLPMAHKWCLGIVEGLCRAEVPIIGVGNTNIRKHHMSPYVGLATAYGYKVEILIPETEWAWDPEQCYYKNVHRVPLDVLVKMKDDFEW